MVTKSDGHWTGNGYENPQMFSLKRECPLNNPGERAIRLAFRFCVAYVVMDASGAVLMGNGKWLPTFDFYLNGFGRTIGPQDTTAAENEKWAEHWRNACTDKRLSP